MSRAALGLIPSVSILYVPVRPVPWWVEIRIPKWLGGLIQGLPRRPVQLRDDLMAD